MAWIPWNLEQEGRVGKTTRLFHAVSFLQYPLLLISMVYVVTPYVSGFDGFWQAINKALIFAGLSISFSTLQDTTRTQNNFSKKIWQSPRKGSMALVLISLGALAMLVLGMYGFFVSASGIIKEVAIGVLMLGIGYIGLLKTAIEMYENHRLDRNGPKPIPETAGSRLGISG